jgi:hypothetical protein
MGDPSNQYGNMDVYRMQAELAQQAMLASPPDISQLYGNSSVEMLQADLSQQSYGDAQANLTGMRAAYGEVPAMMMAGTAAVGGGMYSGAKDMLGSIGAKIRPITYTPPVRVQSGFYGQYKTPTSLTRSALSMMGLSNVPRGTLASDYYYEIAGDLGERLAGGGIGAGVTAAGLAVGTPVGMVGGAATGAALGSILGPPGMVVGGAIGTIAGALLGGIGADQLNASVAQRREITNYLEASSFRWVGAGGPMTNARQGSGLNTRARQQVIDSMREIDIKDPSLDTSDLFNVLKESTRMGLLSGTRDIEGFKKSFKDIVDSVKTVSKVLHTSLEEGLSVIKDMRGIGVMPADVQKLVIEAESVGKVTGRTGREVMQFGFQGAELFRGTGVQMSIGYQANVMNLSAVRAAQDAGLLSQEAIAQAGGVEALAARSTVAGLQFAQSAVGRGYGATFFNPAMGPAGFDPSAFMNQIIGGGSFTDAAMKAAQNLSTPGSIMKYEEYQPKFMSEVGKQFGGRGLEIMQRSEAVKRAKFYMSAVPDLDYETALRRALREQPGMDQSLIEKTVAELKDPEKLFQAQLQADSTMRDKLITEQAYTNNTLYKIPAKAIDAVKEYTDKVTRPISNTIDRAKDSLRDSIELHAEGVRRADISKLGYKAMAEAAGYEPTKVTETGFERFGSIDTREASFTTNQPLHSAILSDMTKRMEDIKADKKGKQLSSAMSAREAIELVSGKALEQLTTEEYRGVVGAIERSGGEMANQTERDIATKIETARIEASLNPLSKSQTALDLDVGGKLWGMTPGEKIADVFEGNSYLQTVFGMATRDLSSTEAASPEDVILNNKWFGRKTVTTKKELENAVNVAHSVSMTLAEAQKMVDEGRIKEGSLDVATKFLVQKEFTIDKENISISQMDEMAEAVFGKGRKWQELSAEERGGFILEAEHIPELKSFMDKMREASISIESSTAVGSVDSLSGNLRGVEEARKSASRKLGLDVTEKSFDLLARAKILENKDKEGSQRLQAQAILEYQKETQTKDLAPVQAAFERFMTGDEFAPEVAAASQNMIEMYSTQAKRGTATMVDAILVGLRGRPRGQVPGSVFTETEAALNKVKSGKVEDLLSLPKESISLLEQVGSATPLLQKRAAALKIQEADKLVHEQKAEGSPEKISEIFQKTLGNTPGVSAEALTKMTGTYLNKGAATASQEFFSNFAASAATDQVVSGPTGQQDTQKGTAEENFTVQTNMNLQVYVALNALVSELKSMQGRQ